MSKRVCAEAGCPEVIDQGTRDGRCAACNRKRDKARGTREQRGYGTTHKRLRAKLLPTAYGTPCPLCGDPMWPHQDLHLDHTPDRKGYRGIVHATCNTSDGATRGNSSR